MIEVEKNERVLHLKLNIPPVNVLDTANCQELAQKLKEASTDNNLAAVVISGEGKCFSAGASVEEHKKEKAEKMIGAFAEACKSLYQLPVPSAILVHGFCFGGALELAMFGDFIIADPSAKLAVPEISLAFFPPFACTALPGIMGRQNAAHMIFSGETIDAERGLSIGLVQRIVEQAEWNTVIHRFNKTSAPVLRLAKKAFNLGTKNIFDKNFDLIVNNLFVNDLYKIKDVSEGINSFSEKRKPLWKHE
jgi:cyclohexa-1,5-dienecarbonyl-CoA hydratase